MLEKPKGDVLCIASVFPVREDRSGVGGMSCTPCGECQVGWGVIQSTSLALPAI